MVRETKTFWSATFVHTKLSTKWSDINSKFAVWNGLSISSSWLQGEMTTGSTFGRCIRIRLLSVWWDTLRLWRLSLGRLISMVCWFQVVELLTGPSDSGTLWMERKLNVSMLAHRFVTWCLPEMLMSLLVPMGIHWMKSTYGRCQKCKKYRLWLDTLTEYCIWQWTLMEQL